MLCSLNFLELTDLLAGDQQEVYRKFREQLSRNTEEWYETGLPWKEDHPHLPSNCEDSLRRLRTQVAKLRQVWRSQEYDEIIQDQLKEGVVEPALLEPQRKNYYMPHRAVIKDGAEPTKLCVV